VGNLLKCFAKIDQWPCKTVGDNNLKDKRHDKNSGEGQNESINDDKKKFGGKMLGPQIVRILKI
jgi:hypothetical protein